MSNNYNDMHKL